jgi:hypothetical protein
MEKNGQMNLIVGRRALQHARGKGYNATKKTRL